MATAHPSQIVGKDQGKRRRKTRGITLSRVRLGWGKYGKKKKDMGRKLMERKESWQHKHPMQGTTIDQLLGQQSQHRSTFENIECGVRSRWNFPSSTTER